MVVEVEVVGDVVDGVAVGLLDEGGSWERHADDAVSDVSQV